MNLFISETAFLTVVLSSIEAYKKECYGLILGYTTATQWRVEFAIPYQTAERGHTMVTPHNLRDRRVRLCLEQMSSLEYLGTFHSHPAWGRCRALARPSAIDKRLMPPGELDLIVAVNDARLPQRFHFAEESRVLIGSVSEFAVRLAAFYKPPLGTNGVRRVPLQCPAALGMQPTICK